MFACVNIANSLRPIDIALYYEYVDRAYFQVQKDMRYTKTNFYYICKNAYQSCQDEKDKAEMLVYFRRMFRKYETIGHEGEGYLILLEYITILFAETKRDDEGMRFLVKFFEWIVYNGKSQKQAGRILMELRKLFKHHNKAELLIDYLLNIADKLIKDKARLLYVFEIMMVVRGLFPVPVQQYASSLPFMPEAHKQKDKPMMTLNLVLLSIFLSYKIKRLLEKTLVTFKTFNECTTEPFYVMRNENCIRDLQKLYEKTTKELETILLTFDLSQLVIQAS